MPNSTLNSIFHEETHDPLNADRRNFYKVEKWSPDWMRVELMLYAGDDLDKARRMFEQIVRPGRASSLPYASGRGCWTSGRHRGTVE
jgi:hypothetical protein